LYVLSLSLTQKKKPIIIMNSLLSTLFLIFVFASNSIAQDYIFKQLTVDDGLSQSTVFATIQDSRGYMWFGTIDGLNRYDGYTFKIYTNDPFDSTILLTLQQFQTML